MLKNKKTAVVIDHADTDKFLVIEFILDLAKKRDELLVYYSGFLENDLVNALPENVELKFISRGFLPTRLARYVYPFLSRVCSKLLRVSWPLRILLWKIKKKFRLMRWWLRKKWVSRAYYIRRVAAKVFSLVNFMKLTVSKFVRYIFRGLFWLVKPILKLLSSVFIEWPLALVLGVFSIRLKSGLSKPKRESVFVRLKNRYYVLAQPLFEDRLDTIRNELSASNFEIIESNRLG